MDKDYFNFDKKDADENHQGGVFDDYEEKENRLPTSSNTFERASSRKGKNIEDEIDELKKKEEFSRLKKFDELLESNTENGKN